VTPIEVIFSGDLILDEPDPDYWLAGIAPAIQRADISIGHLEVAHTDRGREQAGDVPAPGADPAHLAALQRAGFDALTLAGNHIADQGAEGIADTVAELDRLGIRHCGAGANLETARRPAILEASGTRLALLSFNCVGPELSWASTDRAGCAFIRVNTLDGSPITPAAALQNIDPASLAEMSADIAKVRRDANFVVVALHKGVVHTPATLAPYERTLAHAAVDAGADAVIGHHAHILRGIEMYRGKPIFHGLGNGCVVTRALSPAQDHPERAAWAHKRKALFGFEPDPAFVLAPFHPEAVNAMLARICLQQDGRVEAGFYPVRVQAPGRPVLADPFDGAHIGGYVAKITRQAALPPLRMVSEHGVINIA
jgi:poly-gamma-glutamate capsule biosynthesis protein CapA/YwtB (metallophosphatase superfamily)